jgi:hypothetical protein
LCVAVEGALPPVHSVLGVDEEERDEEDDVLSIMCGVQRRGTCGITSRGVLSIWRCAPGRRRGCTPPHLPTGGILVARWSVVALILRQLKVAALAEEIGLVDVVVGVPYCVGPLLRREPFVVVLVDGGSPCRAMWH